jgi:acyl carrier protein
MVVDSNFLACATPSENDLDLHQKSPSFDTIQNFLITQVAALQSIDPADIDVREPFATYGLSSVAALTISGDLETFLSRRLEPTLVWDYPTIQLLSEFLVSDLRD